MAKQGYTQVDWRIFCRELPCVIQQELQKYTEGSDEYNRILTLCNGNCCHSASEIRQWFEKKGFVIFKLNK